MKIIDFGSSVPWSEISGKLDTATLEYMPPEIIAIMHQSKSRNDTLL